MSNKFSLRPILTGMLVWALTVMPILQAAHATALMASEGDDTVWAESYTEKNTVPSCYCPDCKTAVVQSLACGVDGCSSVPALIAAAKVTPETLTEIWLSQTSQSLRPRSCPPDPRPPRVSIP